MDRYETLTPGLGVDWLVRDSERSRVIAKCGTRDDALHICAALNGFNALVSAVKQ